MVPLKLGLRSGIRLELLGLSPCKASRCVARLIFFAAQRLLQTGQGRVKLKNGNSARLGERVTIAESR